MFEGPAREKPWVSWLYVVIWTLIIYVTIPLARAIQKFVSHHWGRDLFAYAVLAAIVIALIAAAYHVIRHKATSRGSYFWLLAVAAIFVGYTFRLGKKSPEEAIHFIQYGVLGILVYRALTHRIQDISVYLSAAIICGIIGAIDEVIQWLIPERLWDLRDLWINFFAASIVQIAIAKGLKPKLIANPVARANLRLPCSLAIVAITLLAACLLNTPKRIVWYAERIPWFAFLIANQSVMLEYGYLYEDPEIGIFRSRFAPEELKLIDRKRASEAAEILNRYQDKSAYKEFLNRYTPLNDPFVHEARVHLFRRDQWFKSASKYEDDPKEYDYHLTVVFYENKIMEKYFPMTLSQSDYVWPADKLSLARNHLINTIYESGVSKNLITRVSEGQVAGFFVLLIFGLALMRWYLGKSESTHCRSLGSRGND